MIFRTTTSAVGLALCRTTSESVVAFRKDLLRRQLSPGIENGRICAGSNEAVVYGPGMGPQSGELKQQERQIPPVGPGLWPPAALVKGDHLAGDQLRRRHDENALEAFR